jgi:hypothetical protein
MQISAIPKQAKLSQKIQAAPISTFLPLTLFHSMDAAPTNVKAAIIAETKNARVRASL